MADQVQIELQEDGSRPEVERIILAPGEEFRIVYSPALPPLRRFLLRGGDRYLASPGEKAFLWLRAPDAARPWIRVTQVDTDVVDIPRIRTAERLLVAIEQDKKLAGRTALVVYPPDGGSFDLELRVTDRRLLAFDGIVDAGGAGDGEGDEGGDDGDVLESAQDAAALEWEVPGFWDSYIQPLINRYNAVKEKIRQKVRIPSSATRTTAMIVLILAALGYASYSGGQADDAEASAAESEAEAERSDEAALAAAQDAGECRDELSAAQQELLDPEAARRSLIAATLNPTLARTAFIDSVGESNERDESLAAGVEARGELVARIEASVKTVQLTAADREFIGDRLLSSAALAGELPDHALLWHPRRDDRGRTDKTFWSRGGSSLRGPWVLGERPLRLVDGFEGVIDPRGDASGDRADPRRQEERSFGMWTRSLLATRDALTGWSNASGRGRASRMAVPPEELHLWTLALFAAWNELPMNEGSGDVGECVRLLLDGAAEESLAEAGGAVLTSFVDLAGVDEWTMPVRRSSACPWRDADLLAGVQDALRTVTEAVLYEQTPQ